MFTKAVVTSSFVVNTAYVIRAITNRQKVCTSAC